MTSIGHCICCEEVLAPEVDDAKVAMRSDSQLKCGKSMSIKSSFVISPFVTLSNSFARFDIVVKRWYKSLPSIIFACQNFCVSRSTYCPLVAHVSSRTAHNTKGSKEDTGVTHKVRVTRDLTQA